MKFWYEVCVDGRYGNRYKFNDETVAMDFARNVLAFTTSETTEVSINIYAKKEEMEEQNEN